MSKPTDLSSDRTTQVVVATSVMLTFISFWRAAAIVLNDLGSSAYYVGGIAEQAVGRAAPWFILGVMLFSYAVRAVYVEACTMFTRGGVYRNVKEALGGAFAKVSVSALMFDYILTGPISGVSAGQYIVGLFAQTLTYFGHPWYPTKETVNLFAAGIAIVITIYFWWRNTKGIHESSDDALKIMYVTTAMVVTLILWCGLTIWIQPDKRRLPPSPVPSHLSFNHDAVGWLPDIAPGALKAIPGEAHQVPDKPENQLEPQPHFGIPDGGRKIAGPDWDPDRIGTLAAGYVGRRNSRSSQPRTGIPQTQELDASRDDHFCLFLVVHITCVFLRLCHYPRQCQTPVF